MGGEECDIFGGLRAQATPPRKPMGAVPFWLRPSVGTWLLRKTMVGAACDTDGRLLRDVQSVAEGGAVVQREVLSVQESPVAASEDTTPFWLRPSVGTWMLRDPK